MAACYVPRVVGFVSFKPGHWCDMFLLGMVVQKWPLVGAATIKDAFAAYWPVLCGLIVMAREPGQHGEQDALPPPRLTALENPAKAGIPPGTQSSSMR